MKEEAEKMDLFEKECKLEVSQKEKQVCSVLPSNIYSFICYLRGSARAKKCFWLLIKKAKIIAEAAFKSDSAKFSDVLVPIVYWNSWFDFKLENFFLFRGNVT